MVVNFFCCGLLIMVSSVLVPIFQACLWLRAGFWKPITTIVIFGRIMPAGFNHWLLFDSSWLGLKKIIMGIIYDAPLFAFLFFLGLGIIWLGTLLPDKPIIYAKEHETEGISEKKKPEGD